MPPGGETSRYSSRFGENGLRHGRHECLPYCINITGSEIYKHQFDDQIAKGERGRGTEGADFFVGAKKNPFLPANGW